MVNLESAGREWEGNRLKVNLATWFMSWISVVKGLWKVNEPNFVVS